MKRTSYLFFLTTIAIISMIGLGAVFLLQATPSTDLALLVVVWSLVAASMAATILAAYRESAQVERLEGALLVRTTELAQSEARAQALVHAAREHVSRRMRQQWLQMQQVMNAAPDGLVVLDGRQRVMLANSAGKQALAYLANLEAGSTLHALGGQTIEQLLAQTGAGKPWLELQLSSEEPVFEVMARAIGMQTGEKESILVIRDVTEERQRRQYVQSQDRLATVGQLSAGIAHDFNNIMAVIMLYSQSLARNPDLPMRQEYLETIAQQARRASDLITQILDFSRRAIMDRGRLDLLPFVKEVVKLLQRTLPENIAVTLRAEPDEYRVSADPTRLQQVLMNLALNARDAMPGGGELQIALTSLALRPGERPPAPEMAPGRYMCLSVADNGAGISPDHLPHLFEPFFSTKEPEIGTGLGLAQVYGVVKQHGGTIEVDSSPGRGARFTIYLPALDSSPRATTPFHNGNGSHDNGQATILLVEDHEATRDAIDDTLELLGYNVLLAGTGREALALFEENQESVDLVLSDMVMPEMGGVDLYHNLIARDSGVKMVVMTGYPLEDQGRSLLEQGIVDWLHKPFSPDVLGGKLREVLEA